jgi:hypothetical protein
VNKKELVIWALAIGAEQSIKEGDPEGAAKLIEAIIEVVVDSTSFHEAPARKK